MRVRARIEKIDNRTLSITEIPYGLTTGSLIESIIKAYEKGKIKIRKVDDNTAETANIVVYLQPGTSSDKTIDALYAFTDCEVSISPNCCVIYDNKPHFLGVSDVLRRSVQRTLDILRDELTIQLNEISEQLHFATLERIFIEERIYKDREFEESASKEEAIAHIDRRLEPWKPRLIREVTQEDIQRLFDIKMGRILRFNSRQADEQIALYNEKIKGLQHNLDHLTDYAIKWYENLKEKYGHAYPRHTVIRSFDNIEAANVADANEKLYINREEGFIGTGLKKDEYICSCSSIDDIIIFYRDGKYKVVKVQDKIFVGKNVLYVNVFKRNDSRIVYNAIYQNGKGGTYFMKRFNVTGVTRDRDYDLTQGTPGSKVMWFSANPNGEAEVVRVTLKPKPRLKTLQFDIDFSQLAIKGKAAQGNIVTKNEVHRFTLKEKGRSTLGGREVWFDRDVLRLNYDGRGELLGEFQPDDLVLVVLDNGEFYTSSFDVANHYDDNIMRIERLQPKKVWTAVLFDADQGFYYLKRFTFEPSAKRQRFIGENEKSRLLYLSDEPGARYRIVFGEEEGARDPLEVTAMDFIAVKSFKAKGKRLTNLDFLRIDALDPVEVEDAEWTEIEDNADDTEAEPGDNAEAENMTDEKSDDEIRDELTGQGRIF